MLLLGAGLFGLSTAIVDRTPALSSNEALSWGCRGGLIAALVLVAAVLIRPLWHGPFVRAVLLRVVLPAVVLALLLAPCLLPAIFGMDEL
jgi:hypothetical protein